MLRYKMLFFLLVLLAASASSCPQSCKCKTPKEVNCRGVGLTTIPSDIPATAIKIDLSMNNIATVPDKAFAMAPNLETVDLRHNSISSLSDSAFDGLAYLKNLFLISNRLEDSTVWTSVNSLPRLHQLYLSHNSLTKIPAIQSSTLFSLVLDGNRISSITFPEEVGLCAGLQSVVLSGNNIEAITSDDLQNLAKVNIKSLDLKLNSLSQIDPAAFKSIGPTLETLNLDHNRLNEAMIKNVLSGLSSAHSVALLTLSLGYNPLTSLSKDMLSPLSSGILRNLQLDGMSFKKIDKDALSPVQKTLELLSFKENGLSKPLLDFTALPALQDLRIDGNSFKEIPPLPKTLQRLTAARNIIDGWPSSTFDSLITFRGLDLTGNAVRNISNKPGEPNSLARHLDSLQLLRFVGDPFNCTCQLAWFVKWNAIHPKVVLDFNKYTCATPPSEAGKLVKDVNWKPCDGSKGLGGPAAPVQDRIYVVVRGVSGVELIGVIGMLLMFAVFLLVLRAVTVRRRVEDRQESDKQRLLV